MPALFELAPVEGAYAVPIERIEPNPFQPRTAFPPTELAELAQSIEGFGVLQPVVVRPHPRRSGWFQLVSGERRWRASQMAGLETIPAIVREFNDLEAAEVALQENIQRQSLTDYEEAQGVKNLLIQWEAAGVALSNRQLARKLGVSQTFISNCWKILGLPPEFLSLAQRKRGVKSSLFAINEVKGEPRRKKYLSMVKNDASFRDVTRAITRDAQEATLRAASNKAPDKYTQERIKAAAHSESEAKAHDVKPNSQEVNGQNEAILSDTPQAEARQQAVQHINALIECLPTLSDEDFEALLIPFARRLVRGDLAR